MKFQGSYVAIVTPFQNGKLDQEALGKLIDMHVENGTHGIVPCGTTGESATLNHEEHVEVIQFVKEYAAGRIQVLAGAGSNSTAEAIRLHKDCEKIGVDGTLHITPYYNKPTQDGLYAHFRAISESSEMPIILYNVPSRTAVNMLPETVLRLAEFENIVGVKEASGSLEQVSQIIGATEGFAVLSGEDALTYPMYALGAHGVISVTANVLPDLVAKQYELCQSNNWNEARELHQHLMPMHEILFCETNPIPVKAALAMMGFLNEEYRLPLVSMNASNREDLKSVLKSYQKVF